MKNHAVFNRYINGHVLTIRGVSGTGKLSKQVIVRLFEWNPELIRIHRYILTDETGMEPAYKPLRTFKGKTLYYQEVCILKDTALLLAEFTNFTFTAKREEK